MAGLSSEQRRNVQKLRAVAQRHGATRKELKALLEAAAVESNYKHLRHGDRDSLGILQQRPSQGWGPGSESVEQDAVQFLRKAKALRGQGGSAGQLAQSVQRSAFPARYDERSSEVESLLKGAITSAGGGGGGKTTTTTPGVDNSQQRKALMLDYLQKRERPDALLELATGLNEAKDVPGTTKTTTSGGDIGGGRPDVDSLAKLAKQHGLNPGENPKYGGVSGGHAPKSFHYSGRALDISGSPEAMAKFSQEAAKRYGNQLKELFYNGAGGVNVDNGKKVPKNFVPGHRDHVHIAV
jgi:hypothetical protein